MNFEPYLIDFPIIGSDELGFISIAEKNNLPFQVSRLYWTYFTPNLVERGGHAHKELEQILISVTGIIDLSIETLYGKKYHFILDHPSKGVYIPKKSWRNMIYKNNAVQVCIASMEYIEDDYIRNYEQFKLL
jgi:hypothetical protein